MTSSCYFCGHESLRPVFSLGELPLGFPVDSSVASNVWKHDLTLIMCDSCDMIQTKQTVPDDRLAQENLYLSETAGIIVEHDIHFVENIPRRLNLSQDKLIMEIGSGDGSLLARFQQAGFKNVIGIEPSPHPNKDYDFPVVKEFFTEHVVEDLLSKRQRPGFAFANYVIELVPDIATFMSNLHNVMDENGYIVLEVPYFVDFMSSMRIDGFAHLRCLWFTINSLIHITKDAGFAVLDIEHDPNYRGGTLRIIAQKTGHNTVQQHLINLQEKEKELLSASVFETFREKLQSRREILLQTLESLLAEDKVIIGYGGGLKSSTLLNWLGLTDKTIKMVVDRDSNKHSRVIPLAKIPINPVDTLKELVEPVTVLILAIDHAREVEEFLCQNLLPGSEIIHLLPEFVRIEV